ncbi:hypothetical protein [Nocardia mexicana]|uniref:Lipoprotein LppI n=1 Tax=Nocardia mexicana TaxID=279262 RepID=A0A370GD59_9NOCA|nr:hypothetical protein [Nocardia mexicana]RDI41728.1 hypothetical protein DFR68_1317 [Nocardia mexicana]
MRIAVLTALLLLSAGCSFTTDGDPHPAPGALSATTAPAVPPGRGASAGDVAAWVQAGAAVDPAQYGTATTEDGVATPLNGDVAFVSPSGKIQCTSAFQDRLEGLSCLVDLKNPPQRPADSPVGNWVGNWIDYTGQGLTVGGLHGDPGPFIRGKGAVLPYGSRVTVKDYTCRIDPTGLFCVHAAAKSGVQMSHAGVVPFGCLRERDGAPKETVGQGFYC